MIYVSNLKELQEMDMPKVIYLIQDRNFFATVNGVVGGHIAHIIGLVEALQDKKYEVVILSDSKVPYWRNEKVRYRMVHGGITKSFGKVFGKLLWSLTLTCTMITVMRKDKPDFIYTRHGGGLFVLAILKKIYKHIPIILEVNTPASMGLGGRNSSFINKRASILIDKISFNNADKISVVSKEVKDYIEELFSKDIYSKVFVNPNGVDVERFVTGKEQGVVRKKYNIPSPAVVIGLAAKFEKWHGVELLIKAFHSVQKRVDEDIYLFLIGEGPIRKELQKLVESMGAHNIIFPGVIPFDQMPSYLEACDILVSPQSATIGKVFHGSPTKLFEYMSTGRAIIASRIGQMKDVIQEGRNGLLFEPDNREALASSLEHLICNPEEREKLGRQARKDAVEKHSWSKNAAMILEQLRK